MNKWIRPLGLLLVIALACDLSGCAQTSSWLAKKPAKKSKDDKDSDQEVASTGSKSTDKTAKDKASKDKLQKDKSSKQVADAKSAGSKTADAKDKDAAQSKKSNSKLVDAEHDKYTTAESAKKKTARSKTTSAKDDTTAVASANTKKPVAKTTASADDKSANSLAAKSATAAKGKASITTQTASTDSKSTADEDPFGEDEPSATPAKKADVVQVKKDENSDDDFDSAFDEKPAKEKKAIKTASIAESFEDELTSPLSDDTKKEEPATTADVETASVEESKPKSKAAEFNWDEDLDAAPARGKSQPHKAKEQPEGLLALCPDADAELVEVLKAMDPADIDSMRNGVHRIGQLSGSPTAAAPCLRQMLKHDDAFVRLHACLALARRGIVEEQSTIIVADSLKAQDPALRSFATQVLDEMGPQTPDVLNLLAKSLKDRDGQIRIRVAEVLMTYEEWSYPGLQALLGCLKEKDPEVRWLTVYALANLRPDSPEAVQGLIKALHDPVPKVVAGAVYALGELGPIAKRSGDELKQLNKKTNDEDLKRTIAYALEQMEKDAE